MAEPNEQENRGRSESAGHNTNNTNSSRRSVPDVNFDEMNFEQRRAPYNSGKRTISDREYDKRRDQKGSDRTTNKP